MKYKVLTAVVFCLIAIQFIPFGRDHSNPPVVAVPIWGSPETRALFIRACADCHSHETRWPWYSNLAPVSWLVAHDVQAGREHFNVSLWGVQRKNKGNEAAEAVEEGEMPPWFYVLPHPEASLSAQEKADLIRGLAGTFGRDD